MDDDLTKSHMDPGSSPAITRSDAELAEIIDERLRVMGVLNHPHITRNHPQGSAGDRSPARLLPPNPEPLPPPGSPVPEYPSDFIPLPPEELQEYQEGMQQVAEKAAENTRQLYTSMFRTALDRGKSLTPEELDALPPEELSQGALSPSGRPITDDDLRMAVGLQRYTRALADGVYVVTPEQQLHYLQERVRAECLRTEYPWPPGLAGFVPEDE